MCLVVIAASVVTCTKLGDNAKPAIAAAVDVSPHDNLPLQTYSANDFNTGAPLTWCAEGDCNLGAPPLNCTVPFPGDFTLYSETEGTFWNSVHEPIEINHVEQTITIPTNQTGHEGVHFSYRYLENSNEWEIMFDHCSRLYQYALSP